MKTISAWQKEIEKDAKVWGSDAFLYEDGCTEAAFLEYAKRNSYTYQDGTLHVDYEYSPAYEAFVVGYNEQTTASANFNWEA